MKETFKYKGFEGSMEFSQEDECLVGEVLFVRSKIIYIGDTYTELKVAFEEAVDAYLQHCEDKGISPEKPCSGTFNVRVGTQIHQDATKLAYRHNISLNEVVVHALESFLYRDQSINNNLTVSVQSTSVSIAANLSDRKKRHTNFVN
jgi:predicted HicB family RNase H-like nuclease